MVKKSKQIIIPDRDNKYSRQDSKIKERSSSSQRGQYIGHKLKQLYKDSSYSKVGHNKTLSIPDGRLMTTTSHLRSNTSQILEKYKKIAKRLSPGGERLYRKSSKGVLR